MEYEIEEKDINIRKMILKASVINQCRPEEMIIEILSPIGYYGKIGQIINVFFNNNNITTNLYFDIEDKYINITKLINIEEIYYTTEKYKIEDSLSDICACSLGITLCIKGCNDNRILLEEKTMYVIPKKEIQKYSIILEFI